MSGDTLAWLVAVMLGVWLGIVAVLYWLTDRGTWTGDD